MTEHKLEGVVRSVRLDRKGLQMDDGEWYTSYYPVKSKKGDRITLVYKFGGNEGQFRNIVSEKTIAPAAPFVDSKAASYQENNEKKTSTDILNCITAITIKVMERATAEKKEFALDESLKYVREQVMKNYNEVLHGVKNPSREEKKLEPKKEDADEGAYY